MHTRDELLSFVEDLISEGNAIFPTLENDSNQSSQKYSKWRASCEHLSEMLGDFGAPWKSRLCGRTPYRSTTANAMLGALDSIREGIEAGRLLRVEDLVFAEAFANLIEQAEYLLKRNYFLASGVLLRAVLEEELRRMCEINECTPA